MEFTQKSLLQKSKEHKTINELYFYNTKDIIRRDLKLFVTAYILFFITKHIF